MNTYSRSSQTRNCQQVEGGWVSEVAPCIPSTSQAAWKNNEQTSLTCEAPGPNTTMCSRITVYHTMPTKHIFKGVNSEYGRVYLYQPDFTHFSRRGMPRIDRVSSDRPLMDQLDREW